MLHIIAHGHSQPGVLLQVLLLAVHGNEILGLNNTHHQFQLFLTGMAADMHLVHLFVDHLYIVLHQLVDHIAHHLLVAGYGRGGNDHIVVGTDIYLAVLAKGNPRQGGHGLALATGGNNHQFIVRVTLNGVNGNENILRHIQVTQILAHLNQIFQATAGHGHLTPSGLGHINNLLYAVDIGSKSRHHNALIVCLTEQLLKALAHLALAHGIAGALCICGIGKQCQNAFFAILGEASQIDHISVYRGGVNLEVAGLDNHACRAADGKTYCVRNGVVHMDKFNIKGTQSDVVPGANFHQLGLVQQTVLLELALDQADGQLSGIDGHIDPLEQECQAADMVLVAVGHQYTLDFVSVFFYIGKIRDHQVHARQIRCRECQTAVHNEHIVLVFIKRHVLADLIHTA